MSSTSGRRPSVQRSLEEIYETEPVSHRGLPQWHELDADAWAAREYENFAHHTTDSEGAISTFLHAYAPLVHNEFEFNRPSTYPIDPRSQFGDALGPAPWTDNVPTSHHVSLSDRSSVSECNGYPLELASHESILPPYHVYSNPPGNEVRPSKLYAQAGLSPARPSVLDNWNDPQSYCHTSQNDAPLTLGSDLMSQRYLSIDNDRSSLITYGSTSAPSCNGPYEEFTLDTSSLPDLSSSRQRTPTSNGMVEPLMPSQPWSPVQSYSGVFTDPNHTSPVSFSPRSVHNPAPPFPSFATSHPEIRLRKSSLASSHGFDSDTTSDLAENYHQPTQNGHYASTKPAMISCIAIPSAPQLFSNRPIPRPNAYSPYPGTQKPNAPFLLPAFVEASKPGQMGKTSKRALDGPTPDLSSSDRQRVKTDRPKRKRMHVCDICGKDFNRPSALLLHASVHTGERSNFCNVCGRSFSNLSNLRRHQRQLHVLESQMPLPEIPGPQATFSAYTFAERELFGF